MHGPVGELATALMDDSEVDMLMMHMLAASELEVLVAAAVVDSAAADMVGWQLESERQAPVRY